MKAVPFSEVSRADWNATAQRSPGAWLFHDAAWIDIEATFFPHQNRSFALIDGANVIGLQPLYASEQGIGWVERLVHSGIHRHAGLALVDGLGKDVVKAARSAAMQQVMAAAASHQADRIQLNVQNLAPENLSPAREEIPFWVLDHGFHFGLQFGPAGVEPAPGMTTCCADLIVDITTGESELFAALDDSARRAVRKATAAGVTLEVGGADAVDAYTAIAAEGAVRTGEALPPREYFAALFRELSESQRIAALFARHDGRRVAAVLLAIDKGAASFLGGCSLPDALALRVNDFLHWSVLAWARERGLRRYRLGPHFPEVPADWPIAKVSRFKTKFGARSIPVIQGSHFLAPAKYQPGGIARLFDHCSRQDPPPEL